MRIVEFLLVSDLWIVTFEVSAKKSAHRPSCQAVDGDKLVSLWEPGDLLLFSDPLPKPCFSGLMADSGQS